MLEKEIVWDFFMLHLSSIYLVVADINTSNDELTNML